jgi:carotenoid cleavage dioxygenase-like enzyme
MQRLTTLILLGIGIGLGGVACAEDLPEGVEQILERGKIAAIFDPEFVAADEAEIADDAWVLGVVIDGQARAYSLNLLNRHEVVNDRIGEKSFAAVW